MTLTLVLAAIMVGSLHTMAPDHWMPFAALARARGWTGWRAVRTTILCGFGHVTVSAALGITALFVGLGIIHAIGAHLENQANYLLMGFGALYAIWAILRKHRHHPHDHEHTLTEWSLFVLFSLDPCVAVIPMIMAAAGGGWGAVGAVVVAYEIATIATMVVLVTVALAGVRNLRAAWVDRYGDIAAGALIVTVGAAMNVLGI